MPAQKRSLSDNLHDEESSLQQHFRRKHPRRAQEEEDCDEDDSEEQFEDDDEEDEDSDGISSDPEDLSEFVPVDLTEVRKDVQCAICLGIIKKTRTVMECLHRFCRECIDKSMRLGNNECPACRTHCASRRSLRDDPNFDTLITTLYQDIEKYEEEELSLHEEEKTRNKQIQASIAQIFQRQSEALNKRFKTVKDTASASTSRLPRKYRNAYTRRRRNSRSTENQESDDKEDENDQDENKDSSSSDEHEHGTEIKQRKCKRVTAGARRTQPSSAANSDGGCFENEMESRKEIGGTSPGIVLKTERLSWGGAAARSHTRHGSATSSKGTRSARLTKLVDYLHNLQENVNELEVHVELISLDKQRTASLQQHHLCCHSRLSVKHLCEYVANETPLQAKGVEMLLVKETPNAKGEQSTISASTSMDDESSISRLVGRSKVVLVTLEGRETLAELQASCASHVGNLILAYQQKDT